MAASTPDASAELLDALSDAVVVADTDGLITGWHGAAQAVFGWTADEALGHPLAMLLADSPTAEFDELVSLGGAPGIDFLAAIHRRQGPDLLAAVSLRARVGGGTLALIKPVGPQFEGAAGRASPELDRTLGRLVDGLTHVAGTDLAAIDRTDALARVLVEEASHMIPGTQVLFSLVPHDRPDRFRILAGAGLWAEACVGQEWSRSGTVAGRTMQIRRAIETVRVAELSVLRPTLEAGRIHTARLVPLWTREPLPDGRDAVGVLGWYREERLYFAPDERRLMDEFCRLASLLLQRTELAAAAVRTTARLEAILDAARELTRSLRADDIQRALVERGVALTEADRAAVLRVEGGRFTTVAGYDRVAMQPSVGASLPVEAVVTDDGLPLLRRVMESGTVAVAAGYQVHGLRTALETHPVRHVAAVRVTIARQPGLVLVFSRRRDEPFTADDIAMLETVAGLAGLALRNATLYGEVEEADRVKTDFLNMAAHELRTPLTVARGYLSMMVDGSFGEIPASWSQPLALLRAKCDELGRLVDELLLAARLDTGRVPINVQPVDLNEVARHAAEAARPRARDLEASLRVEPARRPVVVAADPEHVQRVIDVLIDNALAYSTAPAWIRVRVRPAMGRGEIEVEDRGRGIERAQRELVFERFVRAGSDVAVAGTGLGLHIARELARRQNGDVELRWSEPGRGSRFVVSLPALERTDAD